MIEPMSPEIKKAFDAINALSDPDRLLFGATYRAHGKIIAAMAAFGVVTTQTVVDPKTRRDAEEECRAALQGALEELGGIKIPAPRETKDFKS